MSFRSVPDNNWYTEPTLEISQRVGIILFNYPLQNDLLTIFLSLYSQWVHKPLLALIIEIDWFGDMKSSFGKKSVCTDQIYDLKLEWALTQWKSTHTCKPVQVSSLSDSPSPAFTQAFPPLAGSGLLHSLTARLITGIPGIWQEAEQALHSDQGPYPPSSGSLTGSSVVVTTTGQFCNKHKLLPCFNSIWEYNNSN